MKKLLFAAIAAVFSFTHVCAQVENRALQLTAEGKVECGALPELDNAASFTVQMWFNPAEWSGNLLQFGNLQIGLTATNKIAITAGELSLQVSGKGKGQWQQLTIVAKDGKLKTLVNGLVVSQKNCTVSLEKDAVLVLGNEYAGLIDEVRLWDTGITDAYGYFWNNTLNEFNDLVPNLVAYYKMDHEEWTASLVDYKSLWAGGEKNHHGIITDGTFVAAKNAKLPYLLNGAYTANERFYDRSIEREAYLMSNDIINLGIKSFNDGHLEYSTPCNHATLAGTATVVDEFAGRKGVLSLDGNGYLECPDGTLNNATSYCLEGWLYIDEWVEGAKILRKGTVEGNKGFSVAFGAEEGKHIIVTVAGMQYDFSCSNVGRSKKDCLPFNKWVWFGLSVRAGGTKTTAFYLSCNGEAVSAASTSTGDGTYTPVGIDGEKCYWGEGFKGKMDQLVVFNQGYATDQMATHGDNLLKNLFPGIKKTVTSKNIQLANSLYLFDDPENPGWDSYSQDEWLKIMRSAFDGYRGYQMRISVKSHDGWETTISNATYRKRFAEDLARLSAPYDGVELDLEWNYNTSWSPYGLLIDEIRAALPKEKSFMVSCHNVTYKFVPKDRYSKVDGFTFQQYGPQNTHCFWSTFEQRAKDFVNYGYPKNKIYLSYATTTSKSSTGAAINGIRGGAVTQDGYTPSNDADEWPTANGTYTFMSPLQVYRRAQYVTDNNLQGIFFWDMGNDMTDYRHPYHFAKMSTYGLNCNVDRIVTDATPNQYLPDGIITVSPTRNDNAIYDLQGRRVSNNAKGLLIINGKKVIR